MVNALKSAFPESKTSWKFVKVHYLRHFEACIKRAGAPVEYNACMWEKSHKFNIKNVFRFSNQRLKNFGSFWRKFHDMATVVRGVQLPQPCKITYKTSKRLAEITRNCQLFKTGYAIEVTRDGSRVQTADHAEAFDALVNQEDERHAQAFSHIYETALHQVFCAVDPPEIPEVLHFEVRSGMTIPGDAHHQAPSTTVCVRANPSFQDRPFFSDIVVQGSDACGNEEEWYAHVITFLHALDPAVGDFVYVRYYMIERVDDNTGLPELRLASHEDNAAWGLVPVEAVLRPCHVVLKWGTGQWQLNLDAVV